jgi:N-acetyl-anhydromuramyl-L-alanine amidase AmpD
MPDGNASSASYFPASPKNYTGADRPNSNVIDKIVIHVAQGSWSSALNWFKNPSAQASAHYTVRSSDGFVGQSVLEKDIAWHGGNWSYNQTSVGIEHEGYVSNPVWFTEAMYDSSAWLAAALCNKYGIPVDRDHIIGHNQIPDPYDPGSYGGAGNHTDPGQIWDWIKYMDYVQSYVNTMGTAY